MKDALIIKTGGTIPELCEARGDFEDWIMDGLGIDKKNTLVVDVSTGLPLPNPMAFSGIVIGGSHAMVTDEADWMKSTAEWLIGASREDTPILGICFGHQLLAYALGGTVGDNPKGREFGSVRIQVTKHAANDTLFKAIEQPFFAHVTHKQTVLELPGNAVHLAWSDKDSNQAFVVNGNKWGVQFHPEFDVEVTRKYIDFCQDELTAEGQDLDQLIRSCRETPVGNSFLRKFGELIRANG